MTIPVFVGVLEIITAIAVGSSMFLLRGAWRAIVDRRSGARCAGGLAALSAVATAITIGVILVDVVLVDHGWIIVAMCAFPAVAVMAMLVAMITDTDRIAVS